MAKTKLFKHGQWDKGEGYYSQDMFYRLFIPKAVEGGEPYWVEVFDDPQRFSVNIHKYKKEVPYSYPKQYTYEYEVELFDGRLEMGDRKTFKYLKDAKYYGEETILLYLYLSDLKNDTNFLDKIQLTKLGKEVLSKLDRELEQDNY